MKVYAKFRIDIDKEDESIYTQKVIDLMQKLGCKAEKLYSSMERYTFTVDIKKAVYRELMELKKEIDQVFQYDEDTEEDDDELLDIIEPDIWCSYIPKYTQEEEKNAIGYYIDLAGYEFEENEKKVYESLCPECETFFQNKEYTFKKKKQLEDLNRRKAVFTRPGQLDMFATIPMYEYLVEKGISEKNFIPAYYSGVLKKVAGYQLKAENVEALQKGLPNLQKHIENMQKFGLPVVVALNVFDTDTASEIASVQALCEKMDVPCARSEVFAKGGEGGVELAQCVLDTLDTKQSHFAPIYDVNSSIEDKILTLVREIYGGSGVVYTAKAKKQIKMLTDLGFDNLPICVAKTQYSLSDNPALLGRPEGFKITVSEVRVSAGAGFVVVQTGDIMTMPGLPKKPAAQNIDILSNGEIVGLF